MTAPVTDAEVVVGKFLSALVFYEIMLVTTLIYPILLAMYGNIDVGLTIACYVGLVLVGALYISVGLFFSTCTRNQMVAGMCSFVLLAILTFLTSFIGRSQEGAIRVVLQHVSITDHYEGFLRGLVETSHVIFFVTGTALFLFLAVKALEFRRWR
jgi:ABC-2 type transport system permease protein